MTHSETNKAERKPLLRLRGIDKSFPGVRALRGVDLDVHEGEVLALMGENGAGKSTLIKILTGAHKADSGSIEWRGKEVSFHHPHESQKAGIAVIYQELNLVPTMNARENLFLGQERSRVGFIPLRREKRMAFDLLQRVGVTVDPEVLCRDLTVAQQQAVEIAKALLTDARLVIMDEPSAALTQEEVQKLFGIIQDLKSRGIAIIYVSHRLEEIFEAADRVVVLRDGSYIGSRRVKETSREDLIQMMVGRTIEEEFPKQAARIGEVLLSARGLCRGTKVRHMSFDLRRGEVVALAGLVGSGRTETARLLFGADRLDGGEIYLEGRRLKLRSPRDAIRAGICLLPEDRKAQGLILKHSVRENFALPNLDELAAGGIVLGSRERRELSKYVANLRIRITHQEQPARNLSGGNQQKVVLAKWLERDSKVIIFDEPTRGIDVGAKAEIYHILNRLAASGKAILMISSELPEALGMADRVLVMHEGRLKGEITEPRKATQEDVLRMAID